MKLVAIGMPVRNVDISIFSCGLRADGGQGSLQHAPACRGSQACGDRLAASALQCTPAAHDAHTPNDHAGSQADMPCHGLAGDEGVGRGSWHDGQGIAGSASRDLEVLAGKGPCTRTGAPVLGMPPTCTPSGAGAVAGAAVATVTVE